jgi:hypothetical protein
VAKLEEKKTRIEFLENSEEKIQPKDGTLAELMAEHVAFRNVLGKVCPREGFRNDVRDKGVDFI